VLLIAFAVTDGFDLGVGTLLPFVAKTDTERRIAINTIGPVWEGNQVWLILGGGAIFAAWPPLYAVSFSGFYLAMFAILVRAHPAAGRLQVPLEARKRPLARNWDWALFIGGFVPSLIFGVAVGNVLQGVPFRFDPPTCGSSTRAAFFGLLNPFALLCGLLSVAMLVMHGAAWLVLKTERPGCRACASSYGSIAALAVDRAVRYSAASSWRSASTATASPAIVTRRPLQPAAEDVHRRPTAHGWPTTQRIPGC
jgi:cytochrome d ubiquinol oxidase subunit II